MVITTAVSSVLSASQRAALDAVARVIVPAAYDPGEGPCHDLAEVIDGELARAPEHLRDKVLRALDVFANPIASLASARSRAGFAGLTLAEQREMLAAWAMSRIGLRRTVFQALRRLVLGAYYRNDDAQRALGALGALHTRSVILAHEGPAPDAETTSGAYPEEEPVARAPRSLPTVFAQGPRARRASETRLRADVVVIGSGAGGAVAAMKLAERGKSVVILEEGRSFSDSEFTEHEGDMTRLLYAEQGLRATEDLGVSILQGKTVGGGTTVNWMIMLRTPEHVLNEWADRHGTVGMRPADMAPVFEQIEEITHAREVPLDAHSPANRALLDGAHRLGWSARSARINARDCVRAGTCGLGCRYGAKQGALKTFLPRALGAGASLYSEVRAERVETLAGRIGRFPTKRVYATEIDRVSGAPGREITLDTPVVIVAAGAVETPALLLRSGLGGGGVGRYLRLHPTTVMLGVYDHDIHPEAGIPLSVICDEFSQCDRDGYGFWIECPPLYPMMASVVIPGVGAAHRRLARAWTRTAGFITLVRDGADSTRSDGDIKVDRDGRVHIRYALAPRDRAHMNQAMAAAARIHLAAGAREVLSLHTDPVRIVGLRDLAELTRRPQRTNDLALVSAHVNGTCRIGTDRGSSGLSPDGERHGASGVFVCDGSALPTAPGVNPQETIMALAWVLAERIADRM